MISAPISRVGNSPPGRQHQHGDHRERQHDLGQPDDLARQVSLASLSRAFDRAQPLKAAVTMKVPTTAPVTVLAPPITSIDRITNVSFR